MSEYSAELRLKEPLTKDDWDLIADADFKNTNKVTFTTPHCGGVEFVKVVRCKDCKHWGTHKRLNVPWCFEMHIDKSEEGYCDSGEKRDE